MNILIDTNIFIQLEEPGSNGFLKQDFAEFARLSKKHGVSLFCHPASEEDLSHDPNIERKRKSLQNYSSYPKLVNPPEATKDELETLFKGIGSSNDYIDCKILYALKSNCADFLISQDEGLRSRAKYADLSNRVFSIKEAINYLKSSFEPDEVRSPNVSDLYVYEIKDNEKILMSLIDDYKEFNEWLAKCKREHRRAWVVKVDQDIAGIIIRKDENAELEYSGLGKRSLKISTFKVSEEYRGIKLGELLLKTAINYCIQNNYDSTYLTAYSKHGYLIEFLKDFGFEVLPEPNKNGELVFYKKFYKINPNVSRMDPIDFHRKFSPFVYGDRDIKKFIVPIQPQFHELLFPEIKKQQSLNLASPVFSVPGNTIKKVYLCHSKITTIERGSLVIFYKSGVSEITTIGIVEQVSRTEDISNAIRIIGKRSVYTFNQIEEMLSKPILIIDFRLIAHMSEELHLSKLIKIGVLRAQPQSITTINEEAFSQLIPFFPMILS